MAKKEKKVGLPPGAIVFTGSRKVEKILIHHLQYDESKFEEKVFDNHSKVVLLPINANEVSWFDIRGIHDTELIGYLGNVFDIHPLILEDVADIHQRPKFEEYEKGIFITIRSLKFNPEKKEILREHVGIYFSKGLILTFQETESDLFEVVRQRLAAAKGRIRQRGVDYLAYALVDLIVDNYYVVLEKVEGYIEELEDNLIDNHSINSKADIHQLKKELLQLRKSIFPLREAIGRFSKSESPFIQDGSLIFIRDLYDHTIQVMDMVENYRDMLNGLQDLLMSEVSFKMNQVMQLLTLISTIFIPLTFLAGIYGMNFDYMPELHWQYSYLVLWIGMIIIFVGLLFYFRKKKWL